MARFVEDRVVMWSIIFVLPNISINQSIGNDTISIAPHSDSRVAKEIGSNPYAKALVCNFTDQFGNQIKPSILIVNDAVTKPVEGIDALVGFRNAVALSTIIRGYEQTLDRRFGASPIYSDYFDLYPMTVSKDGRHFITSSPSLMGIDHQCKTFRGQISPALGTVWAKGLGADEELLAVLLKMWKRRFLSNRGDEWLTSVLFRSLEMAYQATAMPYRNHSTVYDHGSCASLWVSAFEIQSHPWHGHADMTTVVNLLGEFPWQNKAMRQRWFTIINKGTKVRVNLVQKLYKELYDTRNDFLHGNPVKGNRLFPFKNRKAPPLLALAPLLYKVALLSFLSKFRDKPPETDGPTRDVKAMIYEGNLRKGLLKSRIWK
jgi:hypothetical protein